MIRRRKTVTQQDSIRQGSLTAQKGIDLSKAPIQPDTMSDIVNFDVDNDGGLILRKPLLLCNKDDDASFVFYAFDGTRITVLTKRGSPTADTGEYTPVVFSDNNPGYSIFLPELPNTLRGWNTTEKYYYISNLVIYPKTFNTVNSTILYTSKGFCKLTKTIAGGATVWTFSQHIPEPNVIEPDSETPFNPNMLLKDPNVVDSTTEGAVLTVAGVLAYAPITIADDAAMVWLKNLFTVTEDSGTSKKYLLWGQKELVEGNIKCEYLPIDSLARQDGKLCLKLFLNGPVLDNTYVVWEWTLDGITYNSITPIIRSANSYVEGETTSVRYMMLQSGLDNIEGQTIQRTKQLFSEYDGSKIDASQILDKGIEVKYESVYALKLGTGPCDVLYIDNGIATVSGTETYDFTDIPYTIRATVYSVEKTPVEGSGGKYEYKAKRQIGVRYWQYLPPEKKATTSEWNAGYTLETSGYTYIKPIDFSESSMLYNNGVIYNFGKGLKNVIYPSEPGMFTTPLYNQIDLTANEDASVNAFIAWRNSFIAMTDTAVYKIDSIDSGYSIKTISTFTGVPEKDSRTVKAMLNGIIFKSHNKVYTLYPNTYSEDENILRLSEISTPVDKYVTDGDGELSFAIVTPSEYLLFTAYEDWTQCLRYTYSTKHWSRYKFNVKLIDYVMLDVTNIHLFGEGYKKEYLFDKLVEEVVDITVLTSHELYDNITYGDWLTAVVNSDNVKAVLNGTMEPPVTPFEFTVDSGQKSDAMGIVKQFVETKATYTAQSDNADFPTELSLYIDGDEHPLQLEEATDAAVQRGNQNSLVLGTEVHTASASLKDTTVRYFAKHSGKGKSIRYVLKGKSKSRFKLYEIAYRYRIPRSKQ